VAVEEAQTAGHRLLPRREVELVVLAITFFDRVLEFVECRVFRVEQLAVAAKEPVVDHSVRR